MEHICVVAHNAFVDLLQVVVLYEWEGGREGGREGWTVGGRDEWWEWQGGRVGEKNGDVTGTVGRNLYRQ